MSKIEVNTVDAQCGSTVTIGSSGKNVKIEGNDIRSNDYKASDGGNIINQSGTTITLGASGDTINLASGASQTGFGRTGTVDWQTGSIKTSTFTAANGEGYFCNTTSGSFTVNLPAGSAGAIVSVQDYNNTFDSNSLTVAPNGSEKINGGQGVIILNTEGEGLTLVYIDATVGWRSIQDSAFSDVGSSFIEATGGTITTSGNCKIHTFTGPGTFTVSATALCAPNNVVSHLVVAGGGGGGYCAGGGGAAGGVREVKSPVTPYTASPLDGYPSAPNRVTVTAQGYPITVGGGGNGAPCSSTASVQGSSTIFSTITSAGGGGGGSRPSPKNGAAGGSGGGDSADIPVSPAGGAGNTPPTSPAQGQPGGGRVSPPHNCGGMGGGGATAAGENSQSAFTPSVQAPDGGAGATTSISASPVAYGGGGGGGGYINCGPATSGAGGTGGGGRGSQPGPAPASFAVTGTANTGGGGGAGGNGGGCNAKGSAGGSGIVIIRYKFQ